MDITLSDPNSGIFLFISSLTTLPILHLAGKSPYKYGRCEAEENILSFHSKFISYWPILWVETICTAVFLYIYEKLRLEGVLKDLV